MHPRVLLAAALLSPTWGCHALTQRWPKPVAPLEPGEGVEDVREFAQGPEEVLVLRHADPVRVRPAGQRASHPLRFYDKDVRLTAGSWVIGDPGGRAEILWSGGGSATLFGNTTAVVGSPSGGFPTLVFLEIERARLEMREDDRVEIVGGAMLAMESGPVLLDQVRADVVRVHNQSKGLVRVAFREETFVLDPGQIVDMPRLGDGGEPVQSDPDRVRVAGPGFAASARGPVESRAVEGGLAFRATDATGEHDIRALGVEVRLGAGVEAQFLAPGALAARPGGAQGAEPPEETETDER